MLPGRSWIVRGALLAFAAIGVFFMVTEHRAHSFGMLPYLLLGVCVLLLYLVWQFEGHGKHPPQSSGKRGPKRSRAEGGAP